MSRDEDGHCCGRQDFERLNAVSGLLRRRHVFYVHVSVYGLPGA
jgi:hypothetical protein